MAESADSLLARLAKTLDTEAEFRSEGEARLVAELTALLEGAGFARAPVPPAPDRLTTLQRSILEAVASRVDETGDYRSGRRVIIDAWKPFGLPYVPATLFRYLGKAAPGPLDEVVVHRGPGDESPRSDPAWRHLLVATAAGGDAWEQLARSMDPLHRARILEEVVLGREPGLWGHSLYEVSTAWGDAWIDDTDAGVANWATELASRLAYTWPEKELPTPLGEVLWKLFRAHPIPIDPTWDRLLPITEGTWATREANARTIPDERRGKAIAVALSLAHPNRAYDTALYLIPRLPSPELFRAAFERGREVDANLRKLAKVMKDAAGGNKELLAIVAHELKSDPQPLALSVRRAYAPNLVEDLDAHTRAQLDVACKEWDGDPRPAAARFAPGGESLRDVAQIFELADASGHAYTLIKLLSDGTLFTAKGTAPLGAIIQEGLEIEDRALRAGVDAALSAWRDATRERAGETPTNGAAKTAKKPAAKKRSAKKTSRS